MTNKELLLKEKVERMTDMELAFYAISCILSSFCWGDDEEAFAIRHEVASRLHNGVLGDIVFHCDFDITDIENQVRSLIEGEISRRSGQEG